MANIKHHCNLTPTDQNKIYEWQNGYKELVDWVGLTLLLIQNGHIQQLPNYADTSLEEATLNQFTPRKPWHQNKITSCKNVSARKVWILIWPAFCLQIRRNHPTYQRPRNSMRPGGHIMSSPTKFELNLISGLSAHAWKPQKHDKWRNCKKYEIVLFLKMEGGKCVPE